MIIIIIISKGVSTITTLKYSKQREALLNLLRSVNSHPTAEWLYTELKKDNNNLSLATVYRNLNLFCENSQAVKFQVDGVEHYDAVVGQHSHFVCNNCRCVIDLSVPSLLNINEEVQKANDVLIDSNKFIFYGLCKHCK